MRNVFGTALAVAYWLYSLSLIYFFSQALIEFTGVYSNLGQILMFVGAFFAYLIIPFSSLFASLLVLYFLVDYERWNLLLAMLYVFPGFAFAILAFLGGSIANGIEKLAFKWNVWQAQRKARSNLDITTVEPIDQNGNFFEKIAYNAAVALRKYKDFSGRASRTEFWSFFGLNILINLVFILLIEAFSGYRTRDIQNVVGIIWMFYSVVMLLPLIAVTARRLNDVGISTFWLLAAIAINVINQIVGGNANHFGVTVVSLFYGASAGFNLFIAIQMFRKSKS